MKFAFSGSGKIDFLIDCGAAHQNKPDLFRDLCPQVVKAPGYTAYIIGFPTMTGMGDVLFSGIRYANERILRGPEAMPRPTDDMGEWSTIEMRPSKAIVRADPFGFEPIYYGHGFVSNRLHLIEIALRQRGAFRPNLGAVFSNLLTPASFSWQQSTFSTVVDGVRVMAAGSTIEVAGGIIETRQKMPYRIIEPDEYWSLIEKAAEEIVANVTAATNTFPAVVAALTGGRDSRVVYAALHAAGLLDRIELTTSDRGRDVEIAAAIVRRFGGRYFKPISEIAHVVDEQVGIDRFHSHSFFCQMLWNKPQYRRVLYSRQETYCLLNGGLGEVFRTFYSPQKSLGVDVSGAFDRQKFITRVKKHLRARRVVSDELVPEIAGELADTFDALPGRRMSVKLEHHYRNFRNRYHFGNKHARGTQVNVAPMQSMSLYRAARGLPPDERATGRVLFDVTKVLCKELAHFEYDSATPDLTQSRYHRPSQFDGDWIKAAPGPDLRPSEPPGHHRGPRVEPLTVTDPIEFIRSTIHDDLAGARSTELGQFLHEGVDGRINYHCASGTNNLVLWHSALRMLTELSA